MTGDVPVFGQQLPRVRVPPPGPASRALAERLRRVESRNVTFLSRDFPVFWEDARGANVRDADGNVHLDLTGAFGVALTGHRHPAVHAAMTLQAERLVHGMGDVHPPTAKVLLLERLAELLESSWPRVGPGEAGGRKPSPEAKGRGGEPHPGDGSVGGRDPGLRTVLASSGSEAVETALKTAHLATGRPGVVAFRGGYHGLTLGALSATAREYFRAPFRERLPDQVAWADFPVRGHEVAPVLETLEGWFRAGLPDGSPVGAVVVEPVQARGGVRIPAEGFGSALSELARSHGALLIADEIYTGLGRCGAVLASSRVGLEPDLVCLGKILGGGLPLSACVARREIMDAWPESPGEALHTSTFLGHPLACACGVAVLELVAGGLPEEAESLGRRVMSGLRDALEDVDGVVDVRGLGLLLGIELGGRGGDRAGEGLGAAVAQEALAGGILLLPAGDRGEVVELSPPATLTTSQERAAVEGVVRAVRTVLEGN